MACNHLTSAQVVAATPGLSPRQLHFWTGRGRVRGVHRHSRGADSDIVLPVEAGGSGVGLFYPADIVDELTLVAAIVAHHSVADAFALAQSQSVDLGQGRRLEVTLPAGRRLAARSHLAVDLSPQAP
jgi:hypothetical protein